MSEHRDEPTPDPVDRYLREALRHAPDAPLAAPPALSATILQRARAAVADRPASASMPAGEVGRAPAPPHGAPLAGVWGMVTTAWDWLARPPVAAAMASVLVATTLGLLWRDGLMDEPFDDRSAPATATAPAAAPASVPGTAAVTATDSSRAATAAAGPSTDAAQPPEGGPPRMEAASPLPRSLSSDPSPRPPAGTGAGSGSVTVPAALPSIPTPAARSREGAAPATPSGPGATEGMPPPPSLGATEARPRPAGDTPLPAPAQKAVPMPTAPPMVTVPAPTPPPEVPVPGPREAAAIPSAVREPAPALAAAPAAAPPLAPPPPMATPAPAAALASPASRPSTPSTLRVAPGQSAVMSRSATTPGAAETAAQGGGTPDASAAADLGNTNRTTPMARASAAAATGAATAATTDGSKADQASAAANRVDAALADLAGRLRREDGRWTVQPDGGRAPARAEQAAAWIDMLRREAATAGARWQAAGPSSPATAGGANIASIGLLRDGEPRHRFVLQDAQLSWETAGSATQVLVLPPEALRRLADRRP